ncbi:MAG TPA: carbamoyl-phosphate synthase (glutamine-hydrolyzing) small subunit [Bacteroidales bacterium]|nr:carbamoyl-phosphate synthase (glutamine-hydrolyzing) small subunit [Bacteroidales bacterium]
MSKTTTLVLEDGTVFQGKSFGFESSVAGEVVFNTAMTGYPESLTDPSYKGQILVATYPLIGNYGVPGQNTKDNLLEYYESDKIQISGFVVSDYSHAYSHWNAKKSLHEWMIENEIPGIYDIDTRALTKILREKGSMLGKILQNNTDIPFIDPNLRNLVAEVSTNKKQTFGSGKYKILLIDCGVKNNIIRHFLKRNTTIVRVPWDYDFSDEDYDGLFISNGPGDPVKCDITIKNLESAFQKDQPMFGICLGNQLMALASGAQTYKLKYGHRSHNQPVLHIESQRAFITSQNHGFAVDNASLNDQWKPTYINLNDQTNEGFQHKDKPFFSTQFHPEASSGPTDTEFLFDLFIDEIKKYKGDDI